MNKIFPLAALFVVTAFQIPFAAPSVITIHNAAQINITANGGQKAYLCPDSIYVAAGAQLSGWGPEAVCVAKVGGDAALPVVLSAFTASVQGNNIVVQWTTQSEQDNLGWNILRAVSQDGPFNKVNNALVPGAGTSALPQNYSFTDGTAANGTWYYQLEQVDVNGNKAYSQVIAVLFEISSDITFPRTSDNVFTITIPNPTPDLSFNLDMSKTEKVKISVYDVLGNEFRVLNNELLSAGSHNFQLPEKVQPGIYFIKVNGENNEKTIKVLLTK